MERNFPDTIESHEPIIQEVIDRIADSIHPEKIICYGIRVNSQLLLSSLFSPDSSSSSITIDLLIILSNKDKGKRESFSDSIEKLSNDRLAIIPIVHSLDAVNSSLEGGNPFFVKVYNSGVVLYDNNAFALVTPSLEIDSERQGSFIKGSQRKFDLAQSFYHTATHCLQNGRYDVSVLMLHQAVELTCISLLRTCLGYKPTTHSIKRLFSLLENITLNVYKIFPKSTQSELEIFSVLQKAYSDVRYKEDYAVTPNYVHTLHGRVGEFQKMALTLCQRKWSEFDLQLQVNPLKATQQKRFVVNYSISPFESVGLDTSSDVILQKGDKEGIQIESDSNMSPIVATKIEDNRLWVTLNNDSLDVIPHSVIRLTYRTLSSIVVHHSGNVTSKEPIAADFLAIIQNGKGHIDLQVDVTTLDATITKMGTLRISGTAIIANILNTGPGSFDGIDLDSSEAKVTIKDSGGVSIQVEDELNAALEGDGNLLIKGEPRLKRFRMN